MNEIDSYIKSKPEFAQAILRKLREIVHSASPNIEESIKWKQPCFSEQGLVCAMAALKNHVNFSFFQGQHLVDSNQLFSSSDNNNLTSLKFQTLAELPDEHQLIALIQQAVAYNSSPDKPKKTMSKKDKTTLVIPPELADALSQCDTAQQQFIQFSYSKQKDYIDWITSAKRAATKEKRLVDAVA